MAAAQGHTELSPMVFQGSPAAMDTVGSDSPSKAEAKCSAKSLVSRFMGLILGSALLLAWIVTIVWLDRVGTLHRNVVRTSVSSITLHTSGCANETCELDILRLGGSNFKPIELKLGIDVRIDSELGYFETSGGFIINDNSIGYEKNRLSPSKTNTVVEMGRGSIMRYPFDTYSTTITMNKLSGDEFLDFSVQLNSNLAGIGYYCTFTALESHGSLASMGARGVKTHNDTVGGVMAIPSLRVRVDIEHTGTFFIYPLILLAIMLIFAVEWFILGWRIGIKGGEGGKIHHTHLVMALSPLFAWPALRGTLPGQPPIGCVFDVVGFYWAVGASCFTLVAVTARFLAKWHLAEKIEI